MVKQVLHDIIPLVLAADAVAVLFKVVKTSFENEMKQVAEI
jgi:hypothetical protein